eukprot:2282383-Alexandrium_andersonii.AAC.1
MGRRHQLALRLALRKSGASGPGLQRRLRFKRGLAGDQRRRASQGSSLPRRRAFRPTFRAFGVGVARWPRMRRAGRF